METSSASSARPMYGEPLIQTAALRLARSWAAPVILHERRDKGTGGPSGVMHSSVELRKVVERMHLETGKVLTFVDMSGGNRGVSDYRHVNESTIHVYGTPDMFTVAFVERVLNHFHSKYLYTLTEKEYDHEQAA